MPAQGNSRKGAKVAFTDGEALTATDQMNAQDGILGEVRRAFHGQAMGGLGELGHAGAVYGASPYGLYSVDTPHQLNTLLGPDLERSIFCPKPLGLALYTDGEWGGGNDQWFGVGGVLIQRRVASAPGTHPPGMGDHTGLDAGGPLVYVTDNEDGNHVMTAASPATTRIDSFGVRLGRADYDLQSRDTQDGVTRANTTQNLNKERSVMMDTELIDGADGVTTLPVHTAGYGRVYTINRSNGEASPVPHTAVNLHVYPMNLRVETVMGSDHWGTASAWDLQSNTPSPFCAAKNTLDASPLYAMSRQMHIGSRLVGIGLQYQAIAGGDDYHWQVGYMDRFLSFTSLFTLDGNSGSGPANLSGGSGYYFVGLKDFPMPVWGNGLPGGPLVDFRRDWDSDSRQKYGAGTVVNAMQSTGGQPVSGGWTRLCVRLAGTGPNMAIGTLIEATQFYFLD